MIVAGYCGLTLDVHVSGQANKWVFMWLQIMDSFCVNTIYSVKHIKVSVSWLKFLFAWLFSFPDNNLSKCQCIFSRPGTPQPLYNTIVGSIA